MATSQGEITALLREWSAGKPGALNDLMPLVYEELRKTARHHLAGEAAGHTLQTTAVIHEVYLQLLRRKKVSWENRTQFFAFAGTVMRRILIDHAREKLADKRGNRAEHTELVEDLDISDSQEVDPATLLALDTALIKLARRDPRQSKIVELRYFAGLTVSETAEVLGVSRATIKREWSTAKYWLARELKKS